MHWLDAVRYADTCGFHGDNTFPAWPYRDYVLRAFRDNKPFDQFTREQLAGDLHAQCHRRPARRLGLQPPEPHLRRGRHAAQGVSGQVRRRPRAHRSAPSGWAAPWVAPSATTTSSIRSPQRDFYSMKAFFADIQETGLVPDRGRNAWGTQLALPSREQQKRAGSLRQQLVDAQRDRVGRQKQTLESAPRRMGEAASARITRPASWPGSYQRPDSRRSRQRRETHHIQRRAGR